MRNLVRTLTFGAAIAFVAVLAPPPAGAAEPEIGIVFMYPSNHQAYVNGPVTIEMVRVQAWDQMLAAYGSVNQPDGYHIDIQVQRKEGGQWKHMISIHKPFYGGADMKVNLWSLSSHGEAPMSIVPGITEYRIRGQSYYKDNVINLTEMTDWKPFSVNNLMVTSVTGPGDMPAFVPDPPPNGVEASDGSIGQQVKVTWQGRADAHSYIVLRSTNSTPPPMPQAGDQIGKTSGSEYLDATAALGQVYWYSVRACYNAGCSKQSALDAGWRYTATPTPEMIALMEQGGGGRVAVPSVVRDPAVSAVEPVRRQTDDVAPAVRERQPAVAVAPERVAPEREVVTPIERADPVERQTIERGTIEREAIERVAPERVTR